MAKKKIEEIEEVAPPLVEVEKSAIAKRADGVRAMFAGMTEIYGVPFDPSNPDHVLLAAFYFGTKKMTRR